MGLSLASILGGGGGSELLSGFYFWKGVGGGGGISFLFLSTPLGEAEQDQDGPVDDGDQDGPVDDGYVDGGVLISAKLFKSAVCKKPEGPGSFCGGWGPLA